MGGGVSSAFDLYGAERNRLHKSLITSFVDDPMNAQIVKSIFRLKEVLSQHPHICAVAARESVNNYLPTCLQSAQIEYNRLLALYEEHMHLKSSLHRTGFVACPLGHQTEKVTKGNCNVCGHASQSGYICSFCEYYMCELCSFIYCEEGHPMRQWAHAESVHYCSLCFAEPITSGYRCCDCEDCNICDICTDKPGRLVVQSRVRTDIQRILKFFEDHVAKSDVAVHALDEFEKDRIANPFPTAITMINKRSNLRRVMEIVKAQVALFDVTAEVTRLRAELQVTSSLSAPARRETRRQGNFTPEEIERLLQFSSQRETAKAANSRSKSNVACPLGHPAMPYVGCPETYILRNKIREKRKLRSIQEDAESTDSDDDSSKLSEVSELREGSGYRDGSVEVIEEEDEDEDSDEDFSNDSANDTRESSLTGSIRVSETNPPPCKVCNRRARYGFHCDLCEYNLCKTCGVVYCQGGHVMSLWTSAPPRHLVPATDLTVGSLHTSASQPYFTLAPSSGNPQEYLQKHQNHLDLTCFLCGKENLSTGYYCSQCPNSECILCDLCTNKSGRNKIRVNWESEVNVLMNFMRENKELSDIANFYNWRQKIYIVSMGLLVEHVRELRDAQRRAKLQIKYKGIIDRIKGCLKILTAHPELNAQAARELAKPKDFVYETKQLALAELHRLEDLVVQHQHAKRYENRYANGFACPIGHGTSLIVSAVTLSIEDEPISEPSGKQSISAHSVRSQIAYHELIESPKFPLSCRTCDAVDVLGGRWCSICQYVVCSTCAIVYCRAGHPMRIWTMPEAHCLNCNICRAEPLHWGYRCMDCSIDFCDLCTNRDTRSTLQLWPKREVTRLLTFFEASQALSDIAKSYVDRLHRQQEIFELRSTSRSSPKRFPPRRAISDQPHSPDQSSSSALTLTPSPTKSVKFIGGPKSIAVVEKESAPVPSPTRLQKNMAALFASKLIQHSGPARLRTPKELEQDAADKAQASSLAAVVSAAAAKASALSTAAASTEPVYLQSMSHTCLELIELRKAQKLVEKELQLKTAKGKTIHYSEFTGDL